MPYEGSLNGIGDDLAGMMHHETSRTLERRLDCGGV